MNKRRCTDEAENTVKAREGGGAGGAQAPPYYFKKKLRLPQLKEHIKIR